MYDYLVERCLILKVVIHYMLALACDWFDSLDPVHCLRVYLAIWVALGLFIGGLPVLAYFAIHSCVTLPLWYLMETS